MPPIKLSELGMSNVFPYNERPFLSEKESQVLELFFNLVWVNDFESINRKDECKSTMARKRGIETFIAFLWYNSMRIYQHKRHPKHSSNSSLMPKRWHNTCKLAKCVKKSADLILKAIKSRKSEVTLCKIQRGCALRQKSNKHDLETPFKSQRCLLRMDVLSAEISLVKLRIVSLVFYWIAAAAHSLYRKEYNASWSLFLKLLLIVALTGNRAWKFITFIHL